MRLAAPRATRSGRRTGWRSAAPNRHSRCRGPDRCPRREYNRSAGQGREFPSPRTLREPSMITFAEAWNGLVQGLGSALWALSRPPVFVGRRIRQLATSFRFWVLVVLGFVVLLVAYYAAVD